MKLTGKCKDDFEKWVYTEASNDSMMLTCLNEFYQLTNSMQYGVYVDFFDSVGIRIYLNEIGSIQCSVHFYQYDGNHSWIDEVYDTRQEARTKAIEKANEIYNKI